MAAVNPNLKFRYIVVDGEMVEIPENEIHDETSVNSWLFHRFADSQVSSGWMAAAYRCMQNDVIVIPDPSPPLLVCLLLSLQLQRTHCHLPVRALEDGQGLEDVPAINLIICMTLLETTFVWGLTFKHVIVINWVQRQPFQGHKWCYVGK